MAPRSRLTSRFRFRILTRLRSGRSLSADYLYSRPGDMPRAPNKPSRQKVGPSCRRTVMVRAGLRFCESNRPLAEMNAALEKGSCRARSTRFGTYDIKIHTGGVGETISGEFSIGNMATTLRCHARLPEKQSTQGYNVTPTTEVGWQHRHRGLKVQQFFFRVCGFRYIYRGSSGVPGNHKQRLV